MNTSRRCPRRGAVILLAAAVLLATGCDRPSESSRLEAARGLLEAGKADAALESLRELVDAAPANEGARILLVDTLLDGGMIEEAERAVGAAAEAGVPLGHLALQKCRIAVFKQTTDLALQSCATPLGAKGDLASRFAVARGDALLATGDAEGALAQYGEATAKTPELWRGTAIARARLGDWPASDVALRQAFEGGRDSPLTWQARGTVELLRNDAKAAARSFSRAAGLAEAMGLWVIADDAGLRAAQAQVATSDFTAALATAEQLVKRRPESLAPRLARARALLGLRREKDARGDLERLIVERPDSVEARVLLGETLTQLGQFGLAENYLEDARLRAPAYNAARIAMADLKLRQGKPDEAGRLVVAVLQALAGSNLIDEAARPTDAMISRTAGALLSAGDADAAQALLSLAETSVRFSGSGPAASLRVAALIDLGRTAEALERAESHARERPDDPDAQLLAAATRARTGDKAGALSLAREVAAKYSGSARVQLSVGTLLVSMDDAAASRAYLEAAYRTGTQERAAAASALASTYRKQRRPLDAVQWVRKAIEAAPTAVHYRMALVEDLRAAGRPAEALTAAQQLVKVAPTDVGALVYFAKLARQDYPEDAIAAARSAREIAPDDVSVLDTLGVLALQAGDLVEAVTALERANALAKGEPNIRLHLAQAYEAAGRRAEAIATLRPLMALGDEFPEHRAVRALAVKLGIDS